MSDKMSTMQALTALTALAPAAFNYARKKGFWGPDGMPSRNTNHAVCLVLTEVCEYYEAWRAGNTPSKVKGLTNTQEELADIYIRLLDLWGAYLPPTIGIQVRNIGQPCCQPQLPDYVLRMARTCSQHDGAAEESGAVPTASDMVKFLESGFGYTIRHTERLISEYPTVCASWDDLLTFIQRKMAYNGTRPKLHGKKF